MAQQAFKTNTYITVNIDLQEVNGLTYKFKRTTKVKKTAIVTIFSYNFCYIFFIFPCTGSQQVFSALTGDGVSVSERSRVWRMGRTDHPGEIFHERVTDSNM